MRLAAFARGSTVERERFAAATKAVHGLLRGRFGHDFSEYKEAFFTTKPAGEGTGLGLSISHDIIVKQHSGSIEVDTRPGEFTEFRIVLPRSASSANKSGERA